MPSKRSSPFRTRQEVERYFNGETIKCLLCGQRFRRLGQHLAAKHDMNVDDYRRHFGLPWSRGLTSAASRKASGWNPKRREKARKVAQQSRFFERAHPTPHREPAPFLKTQFIQNLGGHAAGFDEAFEEKVLTLFHEELTDAAIARVLNVERSTVAKRTLRWRSPKSKRKPKVTTWVAERRDTTANALSLGPQPQLTTTADEAID
jgi:hypothetical protein